MRPPEASEVDGGGGGGGGGHGGRGRGKRGPSKRGRKKAGEGRGGAGGGAGSVTGIANVGSTGLGEMAPMDDGDMDGEYKLPAPPPEPMINIGSMSVKGSILDDVLSEKKCQLLESPEILEFLRAHCCNNS